MGNPKKSQQVRRTVHQSPRQNQTMSKKSEEPSIEKHRHEYVIGHDNCARMGITFPVTIFKFHILIRYFTLIFEKDEKLKSLSLTSLDIPTPSSPQTWTFLEHIIVFINQTETYNHKLIFIIFLLI